MTPLEADKRAAFRAMTATEVARARQKHGAMHSMHEGLAILLEEFDEARKEVFKKNPNRKNLYVELVQIAAMAECMAVEVVNV